MAMASPSVAEAFFFEELQATAGHREAAWLSSGAYCPRRGRSCSCRSLRATRGLNERGVAMGRAPPPPRRGVALGSVRRNLSEVKKVAKNQSVATTPLGRSGVSLGNVPSFFRIFFIKKWKSSPFSAVHLL